MVIRPKYSDQDLIVQRCYWSSSWKTSFFHCMASSIVDLSMFINAQKKSLPKTLSYVISYYYYYVDISNVHNHMVWSRDKKRKGRISIVCYIFQLLFKKIVISLTYCPAPIISKRLLGPGDWSSGIGPWFFWNLCLDH